MSKKLNKVLAAIGTISVLAFVALFVAYVLTAPTKEELERDLAIMDQVNRKLGFNYLTPYVGGTEIFLITHVEPNGVMAKSGLQRDDQVQFWRVDSLYEELLQKRGGTATIPIRRGDKEIELKIEIPHFELEEVVSQPNKTLEPTSAPR